ncbi:nucleotide exchange factor Fes1-domain-containing protein [Kalaharituber pfeilii]|nr:nucleotide exchange factor Fes1-domain-containing protein [Kalaharituber pfeilii]
MESLLKWGLENSTPSADPSSNRTKLDTAALAQLFGAADDATLMKEAMAAITNPEVSLEDKQIAFDNLEMLCEGLDNANNLENLNLWEPLIAQFDSPEPELRFMAAWVCGTAVQNNIKTQRKFHSAGGTHKAINAFLNDPSEKVRAKSVYAISSTIRNYEPALKTCLELLPAHIKGTEKYHHEDMEGIDRLVDVMRKEAKKVKTVKCYTILG